MGCNNTPPATQVTFDKNSALRGVTCLWGNGKWVNNKQI